MQYNDFLSGYLKSGGWRFGGKQDGQPTAGYTPEEYNGGLLDKVGNPFKKGLIDEALNKTPVSNVTTTGLLSGGGNRQTQEKGWYESTTPEERAKYFAENPTMAKISRYGMELWGKLNPYSLASIQDKTMPGFREGLIAETYGLPSSQYESIARSMGVNGSNFAVPSGNEGMSLADQYASYGAGRLSAEQAVSGAEAARAAAETQASIDRRSTESDATAAREAGGNYGYAKGGMVKGLLGSDPEGPDDGYAALDRGEFVVKKDAVKKYGKGLLEEINSMKFKGAK